MEKEELIYEGKAKKLYATDDENLLIAEYIDQATALNGARKEHIAGKGALNNQISSLIFARLNASGVKTHFVRQLSKTEQLNQRLHIIPLEVVLRNVVAGSMAKRFGLDEGAPIETPVVELYVKSDALDDPFANDEQVAALAIATADELAHIKAETRQINGLLQKIFSEIDLTLVDFKLEFGRARDGQIVLADEISPDTCRLWAADGTHMDKDVFRRQLGDLVATYRTVLERLESVSA